MRRSILKKVFPAFACTVLTVSSIPSAISASAAGYPKLSLLADGEAVHYAKAGDVVEVTYNVTGAYGGWCSTGVHFSFDKRLSVEMNEMTGEPDFTRGNAIKNISACVIEYMDHTAYPEYIQSDQMCIFVATSCSNDWGRDGTIVSFNFTVPENAKSGDVYEFEFWRLDTDIFTDKAENQAMQDYAFSHWTGAEIRIN